MRMLVMTTVVAIFTFSAAGAEAAQRGGGGLSFDCSAGRAPDGQCVCTPPRDSADCKSMEQYCEGEITCGWAVDDCWCNQKTVFNKAIQKGRIINLPTVRDPGRGSGAAGSRPKPATGSGGVIQLKR